MTAHDLPYRAEVPASARTEGFADSFNLFALIVMSTFVVAIALAFTGFATPGWLGFR